MCCMSRREPLLAPRVSVPVRDEQLAEAVRHPEQLGLPKGTSAAQVLAYVAKVGITHTRQAARERAELAAFAAYAGDPDAEASVLALQEAAVRGRAF